MENQKNDEEINMTSLSRLQSLNNINKNGIQNSESLKILSKNFVENIEIFKRNLKDKLTKDDPDSPRNETPQFNKEIICTEIKEEIPYHIPFFGKVQHMPENLVSDELAEQKLTSFSSSSPTKRNMQIKSFLPIYQHPKGKSILKSQIQRKR